MSSDVYESFINTIRAETLEALANEEAHWAARAWRSVEGETVSKMRKAILDRAARYRKAASPVEADTPREWWGSRDDARATMPEFTSAQLDHIRADTYRISYQKYLMETPGNFASVRDAVEDAFRAGWEAHE